jgi:hypothetical protein
MENQMPVAIVTTDFPEGVGPDTYDSVNSELDLSSDPAAGLTFHWAGYVDGKWTISDVWESRDAYDRFHAERLFPAVQNASGIDPTLGPQPTITEHPVHDYVKAS